MLDCDDDTPEFHNRLVLLLRDRVQALMDSYINSLPEGMRCQLAEQENWENQNPEQWHRLLLGLSL